MTTLVSSKRSTTIHGAPLPMQSFKGTRSNNATMSNSMNNNSKQSSSSSSLTYQQKKKQKLAIFRSKFENPLGYESSSMTVYSNPQQPPSRSSTTKTMYSTATTTTTTRNHPQRRSKSSVPSSTLSSSTTTLSAGLSFMEPKNNNNTSQRSVKKEWDNRFAYSTEHEHVRSPSHDQKSPLRFSTAFFEKEEEYWRNADLDDLDISGYLPTFNFKPLFSLKKQHVSNLPIDWHSFDIDSLEDEYHELSDYTSARNYLYHLWVKLSIPNVYQMEFEKEHCQKDTITNRTFIFSEIATMETLRDKVRIALIWLDGKTDDDIEENSSEWCQIADSFKQEYEYMYKTKKFIYNGRDLFTIIAIDDGDHEAHLTEKDSLFPNKEA